MTKRIYFLQQRTFEGFTYAADSEYEVSEVLYRKLLQTFPMVTQSSRDAKAEPSPETKVEEAPAEVSIVEEVLESESSEVEIEPVVEEGAGEIPENDEAEVPEEDIGDNAPLNLPGVPEKAVELLLAAGFTSNEKVAGASDEELRAIDGIGPSYLDKIRAALN